MKYPLIGGVIGAFIACGLAIAIDSIFSPPTIAGTGIGLCLGYCLTNFGIAIGDMKTPY